MASRKGRDGAAKVRLTRRGWGVTAVGVLGVLVSVSTGLREVLVAAIILLVAPLFSALSLLAWRPALVVQRRFGDGVVGAGEALRVAVQLWNVADRPCTAAIWRDIVTGGLEGPDDSPLPALDQRRLGGSAGPDTAVRTETIRAIGRGRGSIGPVIVRNTDPFGFAVARRGFGPVQEVVITPRVFALSSGALGAARGDGSDLQRARGTTPNPDESIARPFLPGDSLRRVHWRATAKRDQLMARQEERRGVPQALIYFGARRMPSDAGTIDVVFESAVELVASLSVRLSEDGLDVGLLDSGRRAGQRSGEPARAPERMANSFASTRVSAERILVDLADIREAAADSDDRLDELASWGRLSGAAMPVFAVLACGDLPAAERLAELRAVFGQAMAFVFAAPSHADSAQAASAVLRSHAWTVVIVGTGESAASAWRRAIAEPEPAVRTGRVPARASTTTAHDG